jgi:AraC-like DNA-binding protein
MSETSEIPVEYLRLMAEQLQHGGVSVDAWLGKSGMSASALEDAGPLIGYPAFRQLLRTALELSQEPALGLLVGRRLVASTHGVVGAAAVNSTSVRQALGVVESFSRLRMSLFTISHEASVHELRIVFREAFPLGDIERPMLEGALLSIKNVLDEITMGACQVREVAFPFAAPDYAALARDIFGCKVRYGQAWAGFSASPAVLDVPLKRADPAAFQEAARICERELARLSASESLSTRVRRLLLESQNGFPSLNLTARLFLMTPRTLHRRLIEEGTAYREILESVRHTLAVEHVKSGRFTMDEIAYRLGYTDLANFRRAFKRWESLPPSVFREREKGKPGKT